MSEKSKMLRGELYDANYDRELLEERNRCKDLCHAYNLVVPSDNEQKKILLRKLLGTVDDTAVIVAPFWCDYGNHIHVGKNFFANHNTVILDGAHVSFGDNVFIAPNCGFYTAGHPLNAKERAQGLEYALPITVGNDVWIGAGVMVLPGVTIGNNVVIGAGSIVNRDIPDNVIAAGNPCRIIRENKEI